MKKLLNLREAMGVKYCIHRYKDKLGSNPQLDDDLFIFLGDTPAKRLCWTATSRKLPTYRRNGGKMYHVRSQTWLTPREKLASLGFPITVNTAMSMGVPVIGVKDGLRATSVAGNSFHFATVACVQLIVLSCYRLTSDSMTDWAWKSHAQTI